MTDPKIVMSFGDKDITAYNRWLNRINTKNDDYSFSLFPSLDRYSVFDAIQLKTPVDAPDEIEMQFVELKGRNITIEQYDDCTIDVSKVRALQNISLSTGKDAFVVGIYYPSDKLAIWKIDPNEDYGEYVATIFANACTATQTPTKTHKQVVKLPLSTAKIYNL